MNKDKVFTIKDAFPGMMVIWIAFIFSQVVNLVVPFMIASSKGNPPMDPKQFNLIVAIFGGMGLSSCAVALMIRNKIINTLLPQRLKEKGTLIEHDVVGAYQSGLIIALAVSGMSGIFGLVLGVLFRISWIAIPFALISIALIVINKPNRSALETLVETHAKAQPGSNGG